MAAGRPRVDVQGSLVAEIDESHRAHAAERLARRTSPDDPK
jgi:sRNA-binding protein